MALFRLLCPVAMPLRLLLTKIRVLVGTVAAGPGTGKTRVLTARIAHLVANERVPPARVLAVTFTNKAARELRTRITALLGPARADAVTMGTFHSLCLSMLRADIHKLQPELPYRRGFAVCDADSFTSCLLPLTSCLVLRTSYLVLRTSYFVLLTV